VTFFGFALLCLLILGIVLENGGLIYSLPVVMTYSTAGAIGLKLVEGKERCNTQEVYNIEQKNWEIVNLGDIRPDPEHGK
jgi:hypothetical protein